MTHVPSRLRRDALSIWQAGVDAACPQRLVREAVRIERNCLHVGQQQFDLTKVGHIAVVGAGKAGAQMALGLEAALGERQLAEKRVTGWINVPEGTLRPTECIKLHPARPAGLNEPTPQAAAGAAEILTIVGALGPDDLCIALISGGGSALLPAPAPGIQLEAKIEVTQLLSAAGVNIEELNTVRTALSRIKGGGLARACRAGNLIGLIISDVLGDRLHMIASGPTVLSIPQPGVALQILERISRRGARVPVGVLEWLRVQQQQQEPATCRCQVTNLISGNNALAVDAAGMKAEELGYSHAMVSADRPEGPAEDVGRQLARMALDMRVASGPNCLISGGEPVVALAPAERRGLGGRNQQLVLAATQQLWTADARGIVLLSAGTDGEDGPTDAAGALLDADVLAQAHALGLDPADCLRSNDAYHFFERTGGLVKTGPTGTNVCDVRVLLVAKALASRSPADDQPGQIRGV